MPRFTLFSDPRKQVGPLLPPVPDEPYSDERPRDVYLASCARIAQALAADGFTYVKSQQECRRLRGDFEHVIGFQTERSNCAGVFVTLRLVANVSSKRLLEWRIARGAPALDHVAGGMVHLLGERYGDISWDLANPAERAATEQDVLAFIDEEVLPFFALFDDPPALVARLVRESLPGMWPSYQAEFAWHYGGRTQAEQVLELLLHTPFPGNYMAHASPAERLAMRASQVADIRERIVLDAAAPGPGE